MNVKLEHDLVDQLDYLAKFHKIPRNALLARVVREYIQAVVGSPIHRKYKI